MQTAKPMLKDLKHSIRKQASPEKYNINTGEERISLSVAFLYKSGKVATKEIQKNNHVHDGFKIDKTKLSKGVKEYTERRNFKSYKRMERPPMVMNWPN